MRDYLFILFFRLAKKLFSHRGHAHTYFIISSLMCVRRK